MIDSFYQFPPLVGQTLSPEQVLDLVKCLRELAE